MLFLSSIPCHLSSSFISFPLHSHSPKPSNFKIFRLPISCGGKKMETLVTNSNTTSFGFKNLIETFTVNVQKAEGRELNVPLIASFTIATSRLEKIETVAIRIELINGCVGWGGEAPILSFVTAEDQPLAMNKAAEACEFLKRSPGMTLSSVLGEVGGILQGHQFTSLVGRLDNSAVSASRAKLAFKSNEEIAIQVRTIPLDEVIPESVPVVLLKIDVQG